VLFRSHEGDLFGEVALLTEGPATATVSAQGPVLTVALSATDFKTRVLQDSQAMISVKKLAQARLERTAKLDRETEADVVEDARV
jgi:CRP-like cAMP-binding protein